MDAKTLLDGFPIDAPKLRTVWTAIVDIAPREDLGRTNNVQRFIVPILGGEFFAGDGIEGLNGRVLPGGADRQTQYSEKYKELDALYEMRTDDGSVLTIHNRVKIDEAWELGRYAISTIRVTAPEGRFDWMNRRTFIGTMQTARPHREAVMIRAWSLDWELGSGK